MKTLFLPGLAANETVWQQAILALSSRRDPVIESQVLVAKEGANRAEMAKAIVAQAPEYFFLVGHSMGGWLGQEIAFTYPKRVLGLVLINAWASHDENACMRIKQALVAAEHGQFEAALRAHVLSLVHPDRLEDLHMMGALQASHTALSFQVIHTQMQAMLHDFSTEALLPKITCPTLVISGRQDAFFGQAEQEKIATTLPKGELAFIEKCGHTAPLENPAEVGRMISAFLRNHGSTAPSVGKLPEFQPLS